MVKARSIGTGLGAFFNNPGVIILGGLAVLLLFFRGDIRNAFAAIPGALGGGLGGINIQLPEINLPDITFPSFDFGGLFQGFNPFPNAVLTPEGEVAVIPLGEPGAAVNPADAPTNPTPIDVALSEGATPAEIAAMQTPEEMALDPNLDITRFNPPGVTGFGLAESPQGVPIIDPLNPAGLMGDIAQAIIPETQAEFQERAFSTAEARPDIFFNTSFIDEIRFGRQLSRESENFEDVLALEANRSEAIFASLFGNVQNPNF